MQVLHGLERYTWVTSVSFTGYILTYKILPQVSYPSLEVSFVSGECGDPPLLKENDDNDDQHKEPMVNTQIIWLGN